MCQSDMTDHDQMNWNLLIPSIYFSKFGIKTGVFEFEKYGKSPELGIIIR